MIQSIYTKYANGVSKHYIRDSEFDEETPYGEFVPAIIYVYSKRKLSVMANLLKYFNSCSYNSHAILAHINNTLKISEEKYPELHFKEKYYPCLINQMKKLEFIGK